VNIRNLSTENINQTLQTHANAQNWDLAHEIRNGSLRHTRIRLRVSWSRGDHQRLDLQIGEILRGDGVVPDNNHFRTETAQRLVEVPGKRVEVVNHQHFDRASEVGWERHRFVSSKWGIGLSSWCESSARGTSTANRK